MALRTSASLASHRHKQANCLRFLCGARCDDKFCVTRRADVLPLTKSCPHEMGKVAANVMSSRKGNNSERASAARCSPSVCSLSFTDSSPASGGAFNSLRLAFGSPAPSTGSLLVRFISLHIKPALKGEVANVVSRRGYKAAYSSLFVTTPQSRLTPCQLPVKGSLMGNGFHCMRQPRSSTQKFIVEAASEKKARHLAYFDDSDASDADVRGG